MSEYGHVRLQPSGRKALDFDEMARSKPPRIDRNGPALLVRTPDDVLALQARIGNQAVQRVLAAPPPGSSCNCDAHGRLRVVAGARVGRRALQRMALAVGDLDELTNVDTDPGKKRELSEPERKHASIITEAIKKYVEQTGETRVYPWRKDKNDYPLASIGKAEGLRIYGHGGSYEGDDLVSKIGGYDAQALVDKLIDLGLPKGYSGEIYLTGCNTARGDNLGFLGEFYDIIRLRCPRVKVRGNLATATTFQGGTQGVWAGHVTESEYKEYLQNFRDQSDQITREAAAAAKDFERMYDEYKAAAKAGKQTDVNAVLAKAEQIKQLDAKIQALLEEREHLERVAYSSKAEFTKVLPEVPPQ
jgi:hypothetical protein